MNIIKTQVINVRLATPLLLFLTVLNVIILRIVLNAKWDITEILQ